MMELNGTDIVEMTVQCKQATSVLRANVYMSSGCVETTRKGILTPDFDLVVVTTSHKKLTGGMNCNSTNGTCRRG